MRVLFFLLLAPALAWGYPAIPDRKMSPGQLCSPQDKDFREYRYPERIAYCGRNVSSAVKKRVYDAYRIPHAERQTYTIDHIIPLSIGGNNSVRNLWPEHKAIKATRPHLEEQLFVAVRDGELEQKEAVRRILEVKFRTAIETRYDSEPCDVSACLSPY